ncbi:MAG: branched-chain amino acid aminotransferase [Saprospiraceae bacterium]
MDYSIKIEKTKKSKITEVDLEKAPFGRVFTDHMFVVDYINHEWVNATIMPVQSLAMHPANLTLHYGQAIFEGMKATKDINGLPVLFRPELNARRMNTSARRMSMAEIPEELFLEALETLIELDSQWIPSGPEGSLYIRPYMYAQDSFIGVAASESYRFVILLLPVGPYFSAPVKLWVERDYIRAAKGGTGAAKSAGNYAGSLYPAKMARQKGYDQILWLDAIHHKFIEESGTMNVFFVIGDVVVTPSLEGTILEGITRASVITILKEKGYTVQERAVSIDELYLANEKGILLEAFGVGTAVVVIPVQSIADGENKIEFATEKFQIAPMLKAEINGIRKGILPDKHHWIKKIQVKEPVIAE